MLIHEVNLNPGAFSDGQIGLIPVPGQPSPSSTGAMWTLDTPPFVDSNNGITVTIEQEFATAYEVTIKRGNVGVNQESVHLPLVVR